MGEKSKADLIYEQNCQDFRSLNEIMWRVPILAMSLTGGLGIAITTFDLSNPARQLLLVFAGLANTIFIIVLLRLRSIMNRLLVGIHAYQGTVLGRGFVVVGMFSVILVVGALGCFGIAMNIEKIIPPKAKGALICAHGAASIRVLENFDENRLLLEVVCASRPNLPTVQRHRLQGGP